MTFHWRADDGPLILVKVGPTLTKLSGSAHALVFANNVRHTSRAEILALVFANNKGSYHPAHSGSLISTFVIRLLESIKFELATSSDPIYTGSELQAIFSLCS